MAWRNDSTATNVSLLCKWAYAAIRPLVRILKSSGVSQTVILECVKRAYAQYEQDKPKGRTGSGTRYQSLISMSAVTNAWARSPEWTDESGHPRELSLRDDDPRGFAALVRAVDPQLDAAASLKELLHIRGVAVATKSTHVRLLRHHLGHAREESFLVEPVLSEVQRFIETMEYNIFDKIDGEARRIQMTASRFSIDPGKFADFARFAARNGQVFLESLDDRLNSYAQVPVDSGANYGVGVYLFYDPPVDTASEHSTERDAPPNLKSTPKTPSFL